jgi:hypothetical protein
MCRDDGISPYGRMIGAQACARCGETAFLSLFLWPYSFQLFWRFWERVCQLGQEGGSVSGFAMRRLGGAEAERASATALLVESFFESPLFLFAFPEPDDRRFALRALFAALVEDALRFGRVEAAYADRIVGALLWYPPGAYPLPLSRELLGLPNYLRVLARCPLGVVKLYRAQAALDRLRPAEPHSHGYFLGGQTGMRTGAALSRRMLDEADAHHWPVYLETQDPRAVVLYRRLGCVVLQEGVEILPGAPPTWTMWREAQA